MKVKKTYFCKTSSLGRAGCRNVSKYWTEIRACSKAEIRERFRRLSTRVEWIITEAEMKEILAQTPDAKVLWLDD